MYLGDYLSGTTVYFQWNSFGLGGESITRATNGTIKVYKNNDNATEVTTGVTDTEDFDSLAGVHAVAIATTDGFYATGKDYAVVLVGAVIDGRTVNVTLAHFSIENRSHSASLASLHTKVDAIDDFVDTEVAAIKAKTDNLPSDPADASDIAGSFTTVNTTLSTIAGYLDTEVAAILAAVDTEVAAIKAKTDNLPSDPADDSDIDTQLAAIKTVVDAILVDTGTSGVKVDDSTPIDANIEQINTVPVTGDGSLGNEFNV